jgi:multiple sugar transport system permease protein/cellobiose transport system permease protein
MFGLIVKLLLTVFLGISVFPFFIVLIMGTWQNDKLMEAMPFLPSNFYFENLKTVIGSNFLRYYCNSLIVSISAILLAAFSSSLLGFAIAKYDFRFKKVIRTFVIVTMMVPMQVAIIGYVIEMRSFHLTNTLFPIIVCWIASPFSAFFMMQYMKEAVPTELIESARMDGCSEPRIFASMVLPVISPGIATIAILVFLWSWNSYMLPLIVIGKARWFTIPLFINSISAEYRDDYGARMAAFSLTIFPVLIVFSMSSRRFISGISAGAIKG